MLYKDAGVDIDKADRLVEYIKKLEKSIGGFGGLFPMPSKYKNPVLVSSVDGVGTKLKIAYEMKRHDTIGKDIVNHCVNDILTTGAEPLFFMDYIGTGKLDFEIGREVLKGIKSACDEQRIILLGGETAEMPGFYSGSEYDLVGFIVGIVEKKDIIDTSKIKAGDKLLGLKSNGFHTNGYSLIRKIIETKKIPLNFSLKETGTTLGEELIRVHRCYRDLLIPILPLIKGISHITGGGIYGNTKRILPEGLGLKIDKNSWEIPPIFNFIQEQGEVPEEEMFKVFNMGIGMIIIVNPEDINTILSKINEKVYIIGEVVNGGEE